MYKGDRSCKETLVEYRFRLPRALDNRPLRFHEWRSRAHQTSVAEGYYSRCARGRMRIVASRGLQAAQRRGTISGRKRRHRKNTAITGG